MKTVIDISKYNPVSDYSKVAKKVDGVIVRAGYRSYAKGILTVDPTFKTHIENFIKLGKPVGIYFFTTAINATEGAQEAEFAVSLIKNYKISFPIFVDSEMSNKDKNGRSDRLNKAQRTAAVVGFCERIKQLGYTPGIYASDSWFVSQLDFDKVKNYKLWVASYSKAPVYVKSYTAWQYSSNYMVDGIAKRVDCSHWYDNIGETKEEEKLVTPSNKTTDNPYKKPISLVKKGTKGNMVRWIQFELNKHGYKLSVDGDFGPKTEAAVKDYQKKHKLEVDGIVGPKTIDSLLGKKVKAAAPAPVAAAAKPVKTVKASTAASKSVVKEESKATSNDNELKGKMFYARGITVFENPITTTPKKKISGNHYIVSSKVDNGRVQVSFIKDGAPIGWIAFKELRGLI